MTKKIVVLSGVNLMDGGPLSVYRDALDGLASSPYASQYDIKALVHKRELFSEYCDIFDVIEFPDSKSSWLKRLKLEYIGFNRMFRDEDVFWWISMHDISPRVHAENQAVYCHNSTPFLKMDLREARFGRKEYLFSKFYKYLYALNIHSNRYVVVQQEWLRKEFCRMYNLDNVLVASPSSTQLEVALQECETKNGSIFRLCYPALPRVYKNFEIVGDACTILEEQGVEGFEIALTLEINTVTSKALIFSDCLNAMRYMICTQEVIVCCFRQSLRAGGCLYQNFPKPGNLCCSPICPMRTRRRLNATSVLSSIRIAPRSSPRLSRV